MLAKILMKMYLFMFGKILASFQKAKNFNEPPLHYLLYCCIYNDITINTFMNRHKWKCLFGIMCRIKFNQTTHAYKFGNTKVIFNKNGFIFYNFWRKSGTSCYIYIYIYRFFQYCTSYYCLCFIPYLKHVIFRNITHSYISPIKTFAFNHVRN